MLSKSVVAVMILTAVVAVSGWYYTTHPRDLEPPPPPIHTTTTLPSTEFIKLCSGLETAGESSNLLATANCLGRIRGYTDSHQQTVKMLQQSYAISQSAQLWCVPKTTNDKQLLTVVLTWVDANPREYDSVISNYNGTAGAMGVLAAALHATYPCTK